MNPLENPTGWAAGAVKANLLKGPKDLRQSRSISSTAPFPCQQRLTRKRIISYLHTRTKAYTSAHQLFESDICIYATYLSGVETSPLQIGLHFRSSINTSPSHDDVGGSYSLPGSSPPLYFHLVLYDVIWQVLGLHIPEEMIVDLLNSWRRIDQSYLVSPICRSQMIGCATWLAAWRWWR